MQKTHHQALLLFCMLLLGLEGAIAQTTTYNIKGTITDEDGQPLQEVTVFLKSTQIFTTSDSQGRYTLSVEKGTYTLSCSVIGYKQRDHKIVVNGPVTKHVQLAIDPMTALDEVQVTGKSVVQNVRESSYNVVAIDAKSMANTTADVAEALESASGVKIRRSGGVGSNTQIALNGFTGNHVKVFMDGIPMQGFGSAFQINNIPVNIADRIEVYKGVVPIELGSDALGGAINIITKNTANTFVDASYSYGSFNTHKSNINFGLTSKSGFTVRVNAFQNYADNDYKVKTKLLNLETNEFSDEDLWFRRFHDKYRNETVIAKVGFVNKSWADRLLIGGTLGNEKADIQNAAVMQIVYGGRERKATTTMGSLEYLKKNLFVDHLTLKVSGNYSKVHNQNIDTLARQYNWAGDYIAKSSKGEGEYTMSDFNNKTGVGMFNLNYKPSKMHQFTLNNVISTYSRQTTDDKANAENSNATDSIKRSNIKNVAGISYKFEPTNKWSTTAFGKWYKVSITGPVDVSTGTTSTSYEERKSGYSVTGYGIATNYNLTPSLQVKGSFEKTYRLPSATELFGDEIVETGDASLKAENSRNVNFNVAYAKSFKQKHHVYVDLGFVYRDIQDYIRRQVEERRGGAFYSNHGHVKNIGVDMEARYSFKRALSVGGNFTVQSIRNKEEYTSTGTKALNYNDRIPNAPYIFGSGDVTYNLFNVWGEKNTLTFGYHVNYTHEFFKEWESYGSEKLTIPSQLSHDFDCTYALNNGKYTISVDVRNLTDEMIFDNYSLQKPGRSASIKLRYFFLK